MIERSASMPMGAELAAYQVVDDGAGNPLRVFGNAVGTLRANSALTTNLNGIVLGNPNCKGLLLYVNVTTPVAGTTPTLQLRVNAIDPITGTAFPIWTPAALNPPVATTEYVYAMYPAALAGSFTAFLNNILPRSWSVDLLVTGAGVSVPMSLGYGLLM